MRGEVLRGPPSREREGQGRSRDEGDPEGTRWPRVLAWQKAGSLWVNKLRRAV